MGLDYFETGGLDLFSNIWTTSLTFTDDVLLKFGTDADQALLNRSTALTANTALTGVLVGTPVTPALEVNSLIISNITSDGDVLIAANDGGNSKAGIWIDGSLPGTYIYNGYLGGALNANSQNITSVNRITAVEIYNTSGIYIATGLGIYPDAATDGNSWAGVARDVDGAAWVELLRLTNANNPKLELCKGGGYLGFYNATPIAKVVDARIDDVINSGDATTDGVIDAIRDALISYGLIAAA